MCPPTSFSDHRISASRKICAIPQKDFFDSIGQTRHIRDARAMSVSLRRIQPISATPSNLRGEEVCHGDVADLVHGSAESRAVGAMEERAKCCGHLAGAGKEE